MKKWILGAAAAALLPIFAQADQPRDEFFWLSEINKASCIINTEEGLLEKTMGERIAKGISAVITNGNKENGPRPKQVIKYEPYLIKEVGMDATMLHIGRSSQDMHATYRTAIIRDNTLKLSETLTNAMEVLNTLAKNNQATIVSNYTNGVAAQPNSYAHYLMGYQAAFSRDLEKIRNFYQRLNYCAMGTTVLNGTSWPLDRQRMADYLGFAGPVPNAYDAGQMKSVDEPVELAAIATSIALHVGTFIQDVSVQYAQPRPWILLQEGGDNTYVSSAMPQKRNPGLMINTRAAASDVIGQAQTVILKAHNIPPGMSDPKSVSANAKLANDTSALLKQFTRVIKALRVNPERALEELNSDWTASQEVADVLMREYKLPFRVGHHVASHIVTYARNNNLSPTNFPYEQVKKIYAEVIKSEYPQGNPVCPMSEQELRDTLNPTAIVANRKTEGGPQPAELTKALSAADAAIAEQREWTKQNRRHIDQSLAKLDADFQKLVEQK